MRKRSLCVALSLLLLAACSDKCGESGSSTSEAEVAETMTCVDGEGVVVDELKCADATEPAAAASPHEDSGEPAAAKRESSSGGTRSSTFLWYYHSSSSSYVPGQHVSGGSTTPTPGRTYVSSAGAYRATPTPGGGVSTVRASTPGGAAVRTSPGAPAPVRGIAGGSFRGGSTGVSAGAGA